MSQNSYTLHPFVVGCSLLCLGALVLAGVLFLRDSPGPGTRATVPGGPNPAANVPHYSQDNPQRSAGGAIYALQDNALVLVSKTGGTSASAVATTTFSYDAKTQIFRQGAQKSQAQQTQEMQEFIATIERGNDPTLVYLAPDTYEHIPLKPVDLRAGIFVSIAYVASSKSGVLYAQSIEVLKAGE